METGGAGLWIQSPAFGMPTVNFTPPATSAILLLTSMYRIVAFLSVTFNQVAKSGSPCAAASERGYKSLPLGGMPLSDMGLKPGSGGMATLLSCRSAMSMGEGLSGQGRTEETSATSRLVVHLQSGFRGDSVVVTVNGRRAYAKEDVRTLRTNPYADSFEVEVPRGPVAFSIDVPSKDLSQSIDLEVRRTIFLGVSIVGHEILIQKQLARFQYG